MDSTKVLARVNIKHSIRYEYAIEKLKNTKVEIEQVEIKLKALIQILNGLESSEDTVEPISSPERMMKEYEELQLKLVKLPLT